uniref:Uncharacterized protein n=1 Tax=Anguilla anguilla TaxID=7936 RepID=A0A0E9TNM4_ANGAN
MTIRRTEPDPPALTYSKMRGIVTLLSGNSFSSL